MCDEFAVSLVISELDICRDPAMDLLDECIAERCLREVLAKESDVVLVTPLCGTNLKFVLFSLAQNPFILGRLCPLSP